MTSFGKYQVVELIGQGGFGRVFKAYDPALKRPVAVKTCSLQDDDMRARFGREAEIAGNLRHPHIVTVYDYGHENGEPYLVQEYLEGEDLDHKLKRGDVIDPGQLLEWLRQTAEGLEYAHRHGVLHRDVKPANIRVLPAGDVRIMDFGIAKLLEEDRQLTRTGMSVGTAGYLAPEQLMGVNVDHRADIFSFGAMAYELVAGQKPFEADSFTAILFRIAHEEPTPLPLVAPGCDPRLVALIERCLRKDREARYASFVEVVDELRSIATTPAPTPAPTPSSAAHGSATMAFAGTPTPAVSGAAAVAAGGAPAAMPEGAAASGDSAPRATRRWFSPAAWGLAAATVVVAGFGVLNMSQLGTGAPPESGLPAVTVPMDAVDNTPSAGAEDGRAGSAVAAGGQDVPAGGAGVRSPDAGGSGSTAPANTGSAAAAAPQQPTAPAADGPAVDGPVLDTRRVVVLVAGTVREIADAAETTLISALQEAGYDVRDAELVSGVDAAGAAGAHVSSLLGVGRAAGAATVIVADVSADARPIVAGMYSGTAAVTMKVYGTAAGDLLATERFEVGSAQSRAEPGPTAVAAATAAVRAAAFQAARSAVRRLDGAGRR